ncbi:MAG TPA: hydrogenase expression/formation protein HypE [Anaerolineae bacterium]|nr:hydrogenase expression/formation protein HypE [Anaerolineae bacterium]HOQ98860.1 hydrogenase expression/formation protein HypE [Anaerolineae bacterium]HPL28647.1 hydrogenase expression/formation protein HypE [Anaerolineae bacterium]
MSNVVLLAHGSGGRLSHDLVTRVFGAAYGNPILARMDDAATLPMPPGSRLAFTTDGFVVRPLFFPGGDIGRLAVCGTVNDLAMSGAQPLALSAALVIEEGFAIADLERIAASMALAAREAGVEIVTGDTKVVERGHADGCFVTTAGVGAIADGVDISGANARPGDVVLLNGPVGDHGMAIMSRREGLRFEAPLASDAAPLNGLVKAMLEAGPGIRCLRDPTRGGLATTLNELAGQSQVTIIVEEARIPVRPAVRGLCELLGLDPLYVANEGKLVAIVAPEAAERVLAAMQAHALGRDSVAIGRVEAGRAGRVALRTTLGAHRVLDMMAGELLPRIC